MATYWAQLMAAAPPLAATATSPPSTATLLTPPAAAAVAAPTAPATPRTAPSSSSALLPPFKPPQPFRRLVRFLVGHSAVSTTPSTAPHHFNDTQHCTSGSSTTPNTAPQAPRPTASQPAPTPPNNPPTCGPAFQGCAAALRADPVGATRACCTTPSRPHPAPAAPKPQRAQRLLQRFGVGAPRRRPQRPLRPWHCSASQLATQLCKPACNQLQRAQRSLWNVGAITPRRAPLPTYLERGDPPIADSTKGGNWGGGWWEGVRGGGSSKVAGVW